MSSTPVVGESATGTDWYADSMVKEQTGEELPT